VSTAAIILAAGFSRRLGRPKQTLLLHGETLIARAIRTAHEAALTPIIVVVNPQAGFTAELTNCLIAINHQAAEGIASSIRTGIHTAIAQQVTGAVLLTCDQIALRPDHLLALAADPTRLTASAYANRTGIPAYFPSATFPSLLTLHGDTGARDLLRSAHAIPAEELTLDIDTEADLQNLSTPQ
jgi:molybdenum cofactor cytidylyltransferase